MRVFQLSRILTRILDVEIKNLNELESLDCSNNIIIISKSILDDLPNSALFLEVLKSRNNILALDFVDTKVDINLIGFADILIASSIKQLKYFKDNFPYIQSSLITHHVDPRLEKVKNAKVNHKAHVGYFGNIQNGYMLDDLKEYISIHHIDTLSMFKKKPRWVKNAFKTNAHYAVRNIQEIDGFKPFLKGFTAAHCHNNIIIKKGEGDSLHYLTEAYPYLLDDLNIKTILNMLEKVRDSYGSSDWKFGLEVMNTIKRRSTNEYIAKEFLYMLNQAGF